MPEPQNESQLLDSRPAWARLHVWEIAAVRDVALFAITLVVLWGIVALRSVTAPIAIALLMACVFNPVASRMKDGWGWPRAVTTGVAVTLLIAGGVVFAVFGVPLLVDAVRDSVRDLPAYVDSLAEALGMPAEELRQRLDIETLTSLNQPEALADHALSFLGLAADVLGNMAYLLIVGVFGTVTFAWATVRYEQMPNLKHFLPASRREQIWGVLLRFVEVFAGFVRGQVLVALFTTAGFSVGFALIGVPHAAVAALVGGVMSFIPNGQASGWLLAVMFSALNPDRVGDLSWTDAVLWPTCVFAVTQGLETFVVTPLVQGRSTRLHPLAVLGAVIGGASIGGLLGILLAIPITACAWIAITEFVAPAVTSLADER